MTIDLSNIPGAYHLPRPNWEVIETWVDRNVAKLRRPQAWADICTQWLGTLNTALANSYQFESSETVLLFAPRDFGQTRLLLHFAEGVLSTIADSLQGITRESWQGPLVVLLFADADSYYSYISPFYSEGEFGGTGGVCIRQGRLHIALHPATYDGLQATIAHELTHACLSHLTLPLWLEEGITQFVEELVHSQRQFQLDRESAERTRILWRERGLSDFWWGNAFQQADEAQECSYRLAQIIFRLLATDHRPNLPAFVRTAHAGDAGESAAREHLGFGLAQIAAQFLGPGEWEPVPHDGVAFCQRGIMHIARQNCDLAIADFDEALRLAPALIEAHFNRGFAHYRLAHFTLAIADYERAIELSPKDFNSLNNLAWVLATCTDDSLRDGERALKLANQACELSAYDAWHCLGTLAAANAEVGDFEEAIIWAKESLRRAPEAELSECKERLKSYQDAQRAAERDED